MKTLLLVSIAVIMSGFMVLPEEGPINFDSDNHDFGILEYNVPATHHFTFSNDSDEAIIIEKVIPSCGCTSPDWSKEPISPGEEGFVSAKYNAKKKGNFAKSLRVIYRIGDKKYEKRLMIRGTVDK